MNTFIMILMIAAALWTVMTRSLIRSAIGLAVTSGLLTILMFRFGSSLAAVFELSVCTGLISVLFVSTISLTEPMTREEALRHMKDKMSRFWYLPVLVVVVGVFLSFCPAKLHLTTAAAPEIEKDVRLVLWDLRQMDLIGQVIALLAGVFGVVILLKERRRDA